MYAHFAGMFMMRLLEIRKTELLQEPNGRTYRTVGPVLYVEQGKRISEKNKLQFCSIS